MSKIVCDICGTTYDDSQGACPVCGWTPGTTLNSTSADVDDILNDDFLLDEESPSGNASQKGKAVFDYDAVNTRRRPRPAPAPAPAQQEEDSQARDTPTKASMYGATLLSGLLYCAHCGHRLTGGYCTKQRANHTYRRPIYRCYNGSVKAKECDGQTVYSAVRIEKAVLEVVHQ